MFSVSIIVLTVTSLLTYYFATHDLEKQPESDIKIKKKNIHVNRITSMKKKNEPLRTLKNPSQKFEYIFTIGCFDKFHKGHIKLLKSMKRKTDKIIVGIYTNRIISLKKKTSDVYSYDSRKKCVEEYSYDTFMIDDVDPTNAIVEYISKNFNQDLTSIEIGSSKLNSKIIKSDCHKDLFFLHGYKDTFKYNCKDNNLTVSRTDKNCGWDQHLFAYKKNWCFMRANDNKAFPGIDYIKSIMPIEYLPYSKGISATKLRDYKNNKVGVMNKLLQKVVDIMNENNIPYYLDCGTLLGSVRDNEIMEKDTDLDIAIHLSYWDKLKNINFNNYGLTITRTYNFFPNKPGSNMISVKTNYHDIYCDIYAQPAFPLLTTKILNGIEYTIPINPELFLEVLFDKSWRIPSNKHSNQKNHRGNGLVKSKYSKYWDRKYKIFKCNF
jgi:cytidyltransferase-like protein